ncbi:ADP-ribosylation factor 3-like [Physella acuta]|uniref:ADP-ribosylation factor 3-like n=1 Tax=Physella acuta TaxID=109671 RepID=UPI0027DD7F83|nr:ADP-ribosylation factor 3-like [Physella acuta]
MGAWFSFNKDYRILIQGLDASGKTSLLYKVKLGEVVTTIPTIGFNVETIHWDGVSLVAWDIGGRDKMRPLIRHYYANTQAVIYMIDSNDIQRLDEAIDELIKYVITADELRDTVVMVLANKQDLPNAVPSQEIVDRLKKRFPRVSQTIFVLPCSVSTNAGVHEALNEFVKQIKLMKAGKAERSYIDVHKSMEEDCSKGGNSLYSIWPEYFKSYLSYFTQIFSSEKQKNISVEVSADRSAELLDTVTSSNTGDSQEMVNTDTQLTNAQQLDIQQTNAQHVEPTDQSQPVLDSHNKSADLHKLSGDLKLTSYDRLELNSTRTLS